ncbi:hypothetical protein [Microbacterium oleivorans]|uniref:Uncharacterized protein n=1 Tax=Microbacterium oleivorans TaxID=273677 RepID=A0A177K6E3_9MICO|nr:hypothetical protein [Microbacterium oleivorans]OAH48724.1 hypothetical protein AYL44_11820 [Microbacterium oleivorans]
MNDITLTTDFLRRSTEAMLNWIEQNVGETVTLEMDEFWWVPSDAAYEMSRDPRELTIGSIRDCVEFVQRGVLDDEIPIGYGFVWLAQIFRAVGDQVSGR